jgi:hypothetical protein
VDYPNPFLLKLRLQFFHSFSALDDKTQVVELLFL